MRELEHLVLELEDWNKDSTCYFCPGLIKATCQIRTCSKKTDKIVANACACENCQEKLDRGELLKCERCGRLQIKANILYGKHICDCVGYNEDLEKKELPVLPHERRMDAFYERQINSLQEQLNEAEWTIQEEREAHEDFMEKSEEWGKRQKQELLDRIKELEAENGNYKEEIKKLKIQLEQLNSQQVAQIEVKETKK